MATNRLEQFKKRCLELEKTKNLFIAEHAKLIEEQSKCGYQYEPKRKWYSETLYCPVCKTKLIKETYDQIHEILHCKKCEYEYAQYAHISISIF